MCPPYADVGTTCRKTRIATEFGNQDDGHVGDVGMVSEVCGPFRLVVMSNNSWFVADVEELEVLPDDRRDLFDAETAPGEIDPREVPADFGAGGEPEPVPDTPGESVLADPLGYSNF